MCFRDRRNGRSLLSLFVVLAILPFGGIDAIRCILFGLAIKFEYVSFTLYDHNRPIDIKFFCHVVYLSFWGILALVSTLSAVMCSWRWYERLALICFSLYGIIINLIFWKLIVISSNNAYRLFLGLAALLIFAVIGIWQRKREVWRELAEK